MESQEQATSSGQGETAREQTSEPTDAPAASGDQLVEELGRLGRKFVELLETAWNSDQRRQIEQDLRNGLAGVSESLETGLKDLSEKEKTKEVVGKAEEVADTVGEKVRTSDVANELARGLASGLHTLADELDKLTRELRSSETDAQKQANAGPQTGTEGQDIPIVDEEPDTSSDT